MSVDFRCFENVCKVIVFVEGFIGFHEFFKVGKNALGNVTLVIHAVGLDKNDIRCVVFGKDILVEGFISAVVIVGFVVILGIILEYNFILIAGTVEF